MPTNEPEQRERTRHSSAPPDSNRPAAGKERIREGGVDPAASDPLGEIPIREPYAGRSGEQPEHGDGKAADVTGRPGKKSTAATANPRAK